MYKWIMFVFFVAASVIGVVLLTTQLPGKPVDEAASLPPGESLLKVVASQDFVFDQKEYHVKVGDKVKLELVNKSGIHGLAIPDLGIELKDDKMSQEVTFDKAGTFEMHCAVMCGTGHPNMKSVLIVDPA